MMLLILDFPEPLLPMSSTFFFLGFLTSFRTSLAIPKLGVDVSRSAILYNVLKVRSSLNSLLFVRNMNSHYIAKVCRDLDAT